MSEPELTRLLLAYETCASWWTDYVSHPTLQAWAGRYIAWKVKRKMGRLRYVTERRQRLQRLGYL